MLIVLVAGVVVSTIFAFKAEQEKLRAEEEAESQLRTLYANQIMWADEAYHNGNIERTYDLLKSCPTDLREWEWYHLLKRIKAQPYTRVFEHKSDTVAFSLDGKRIVTGANVSSELKVWDISTGQELQHISQVEFLSPHPVVFHPDGKHFISSGADGYMKMWNAQTGAVVKTFSWDKNSSALAFAVSPDGTTIVSSDFDGTVVLWDIQSGSVLKVIAEEEKVHTIAFNPDGTRIVTADIEGTIKVWDTSKWSKLATLGKNLGFVVALSFCSKGTSIISGFFDGTIVVWDVETEAVKKIFKTKHVSGGLAMAIDAKGEMLVEAQDKILRVWNVETGLIMVTHTNHESAVQGLAFDPNGKRIAINTADGKVKLWNIASRTEITDIETRPLIPGISEPLFRDLVRDFSLSSDSKYLAWAEWNSDEIRIWDMQACQEVATLSGHEERIHQIVFSRDGMLLTSVAKTGEIRVWDIRTKSVRKRFCLDTNDLEPTPIEIVTPKGTWPGPAHPSGLALTGSLSRISAQEERYESGKSQQNSRLPRFETMNKILSHLSSLPIISASRPGQQMERSKIWDLRTGSEVMCISSHSSIVGYLAFTHDSKCLVSVDMSGTWKVWNTTNWSEIATVPSRGIYGLCSVSPNDKRIAFAARGQITICDLETGRELLVLPVYGDFPTGITFSQDSRYLVSSGRGIRIFDSASIEEASQLFEGTGLE